MNTTNLLLSAIVVLLILVIEQWWRGRRGRKLTSKSSAPHIERFVTPSASVAVPAEVPSVVSTASEFAPAPFPLKRENSKDLLKDRVRERKAAGVDLISLVPAVKSEFGDRVTMDDIFEAVADVGYPPTDIATVMVSNGYQLSEVVTLLNQNTDLGPGDLATIIMPLAEGPTVAKRAEDVIGTVVDELSIDDNDDELFELPGQLG